MTPSPRDPDVVEALMVLRAQLGDREAFAGLFARYNPRLLYYLRRLVGSAVDAEDVLQDVWLTVVRRVASLERPEAFRAWIYRVAHNRAISRLRRGRDEPPLEELLDEHALAATSESEDEAVLAGHDAEAIHAGLARLSAAHREVLTLRFLEELSYEEVADVVGCSPGTVRSRIHYGKKSLLAHLTRGAGETKGTHT